MDTLIDSIVQSDPSDSLTCAQLHALIGLVSAAPVVLPNTHALFRKLATNFAVLTETETSQLSLRLALLLCAETTHRSTIFATIEAHGDAIDAAIAPHVASLADADATGSSVTTRTPGQHLLSCLLLVVVASGETRVSVVDVVEFVGASVEAAVHLLVLLYTDVCGVVPGVAPVVTGTLREGLSLRLIQMLHELTFWTTYDALHTRLGLGSRTQASASRNTADTLLQVAAGPYRYHVGQIAAHVLRHDWCSFAVAHLESLVHEAQLQAVHPLVELREHVSLFKSLLTLTDQYVTVLRKALFKAGILEKVCDPLLRLLAGRRPLTAQHGALFLQCVDVTATLCFHSGEVSQHWDANRTVLVRVVEDVAADPADLVAGSGGDERGLAELVGQLVRLVVNAHAPAAASAVLRLWQAHVDEAGRQRVAHLLSSPSSRSRCVDTLSPAYDVLRCVFRIDSAAPVPGKRVAAAQRGGPRRHRSRSRGMCREEERGVGHRTRSRRSRPSRRQRMRRRFQVLAEQQAHRRAEPEVSAPPPDEPDTTDSDSVMSGGEDEGEASVNAKAPLPDVSQWRRGPPPRSIPTRYICALSHALIRSAPVVSATGYIFDEAIIMDYLQVHHVCPVSCEPLAPSDLVVDTQLKEELSRVRDNFY